MKQNIETSKSHNKLSIILIAVSFIVLIPGLMAPMITLSGSIKILFVQKTLFEYDRSILQTIGNLMESNNYAVAFLILFFSVLVPLIKGVMLLMVAAMKEPGKRHRLYRFVKSISKWAMADVFVAGIFVAFLAAKATKHMNAFIQPGFYFFTAYCLLSLLALQFLRVEPLEEKLITPV